MELRQMERRHGEPRRLEPGLALATLLLVSSAAAQEVRGRVLDAEGKPAASAWLAREWRFPDPLAKEAGPPEPAGIDDLRKPLRADEHGEFAGSMPDVPALLALSADFRSGALVPIPAGNPAALGIQLAPLTEVRGRFEIRTPGEPPKKTALWVSPATGAMTWVAECITESRAFRVALPPGSYRLWYSTDAVNLYSMSQLREAPLELAAGQAALDLGPFELDLPLVLHPRGVVLDAQGKPVRAALGESWSVIGGRMSPWNGFETDDEGRFEGKIEVYDEASDLTLLAMDAQRQQAGLALWKPSAADTPLEIRLAPTVHVFGRYRTNAGERPAWTNTYVYLKTAAGNLSRAPRIAECQSTDASFDFRLPPGSYRLNGYGTSTKNTDTDLVLADSERERDLGEIELPQTVIARNLGKEAMPWHLTDARGLAKDARLSDFRGKWVLLEFWGYW